MVWAGEITSHRSDAILEGLADQLQRLLPLQQQIGQDYSIAEGKPCRDVDRAQITNAFPRHLVNTLFISRGSVGIRLIHC